MKVISKEIYYSYNSQRYDLNDTFSEKQTNKGLVICYALSSCEKSELISLELRAIQEEVGVPTKWHNKYSKESFKSVFSSLGSFLDHFDDETFGKWRINLCYQDVEIGISGSRSSTEIGLSYPQDKSLNLLPLLSDIETGTYCYNNYDKEVLNMLKSEFRMTDKRSVLAIQKLQTYQEIYDEFALVATTGKYVDESSAITVEGFTAEKLNTDYPLSLLGAYNYLVYLKEMPKEALEDLKKGLPRK